MSHFWGAAQLTVAAIPDSAAAANPRSGSRRFARDDDREDSTRTHRALAASPIRRERRLGAVDQHVGDRHPAIGELARRVGPAIGMIGPHEATPRAIDLGERRRLAQAEFGGDRLGIVGERRDRFDRRRPGARAPARRRDDRPPPGSPAFVAAVEARLGRRALKGIDGRFIVIP